MGFRGMRFVVHVVLREIFGGKMEKLKGVNGILMGFRVWDLWCMWWCGRYLVV